jgi:hypothetical protein
MVKRTDASGGNWVVYDEMRGFFGSNSKELIWNTSDAEQYRGMLPTSTGFQPKTSSAHINASGGTYIFMAIRRGPLAAPTDATKVFDVKSATNASPSTLFNTGFDADMNINTEANSGSARYNIARLTGADYLNTDGTTAGNAGPSTFWNTKSNFINLSDGWWGAQSGVLSYSWRRAPSFFDVVATKSTNGNVNHNLQAIPEMVWYKRRDSADDWFVCTATDGYLFLNQTARNQGYGNGSYLTNAYGAQVTATTVHTGYNFTGVTTADMIIYLFATAPGVSKVGSVSLTGSAINVDCGFSSGARFVLLKRTDSTTAGWWVWDSARGIVSGNDPYLELNTTSAEVTNTDYIDPFASGFTITNNFYSAGTWIFYAIA